MSASVREVFRQHCRPLAAIPTVTTPVLSAIPGIRAVLWDVYGTLLISASGDVGTTARSSQGNAFQAALAAVGVRPTAGGDPLRFGQAGAECLLATIEDHHRQARARSIRWPEVDICSVWRQTLSALAERGMVGAEVESVDVQQLSANYEALVNPCWPMPHCRDCLDGLGRAGLVLGIISNAQFYTRELLPTLLGSSLADLGFDPRLRYYSYEHGEAKPGRRMFDLAAAALGQRGIAPHEVLYTGNDMLNDILPASGVGYRTALFAGDARSLRCRDGDPRVGGLVPDLVLTDLATLTECVVPA